MKKKQCQAIASSTGVQCKKGVLWGTSYCRVHYPKKDAIELILLGILLSFFLQIFYDNMTLSDEERKTIQLQGQVNRLSSQNNELIQGKDILIKQNSELTGRVEELKNGLQQASDERKELKRKLDPIIELARNQFPEDETDIALEKLVNEIELLRSEVKELAPFKLTEGFKKRLFSYITQMIMYERENKLPKTDIKFILFSQQTPDASQLLKYIRAVFKLNNRDTQMAMVGNSGISPNSSGFVFQIKDPQNPPAMLKPFYEAVKELGFDVVVNVDKRNELNELEVSAQKPVIKR